jgi:Holliday junction resolvase RusA-like endonuclease
MIALTIPGCPVAYGVQVSRHGHVYERKRSRAWKAQAVAVMAESGFEPYPPVTPLALALVALYPLPKAASRKLNPVLHRQYHAKTPDLSNVIKAAEDALMKGGLLHDDRQIASVIAYDLIGAQDEAPAVWLALLPLNTETLKETS